MKKKSAIIIAIILMSIGFASISTTLILNGNAKVSENNEDFSVIFTKATLDDKNVYSSIISTDKQTMTFETANLSKVGDKSILSYTVTNNSNQYDANVSITCAPKEGTEAKYTSIKNKLENDATKVLAKESLNGTLTVTLNKTATKEITEEYICRLEFSATGREEYAYTGDNTWSFGYTGGEQEFTSPTTETYKLEVWGAQGGENANKFAGAAGAYSSGEITLMKGQKFYIYVGGQSGYNGGGSPSTQAYPANIGGYGGGATDIRLINGTWNNFESLKSRIMVAGGGGGAGGTAHTGTEYQIEPTVTGYGLNGNGKPDRCSDSCGGLGGDELAGFGGEASGDTKALITTGAVSNREGLLGENGKNGAFGIGGTGGGTGVYYHNISAYKDVFSGGSGAGGGGGYFGGGGGAGACGWWATIGGSGGGGSSFVSGNTSSKAISSDSTANNIIYLSTSVHYSGLYFDNSKMLSGNESIPSHDGTSFTKGNKGNGYAKITLIK